jgi:hypothetical protein
MAGGVTGGWIMDGWGEGWGRDRLFRDDALPGVLGFADGMLMNILAILSGLLRLTYAWIVVIPEVFPTERRGAMGWTTTLQVSMW